MKAIVSIAIFVIVIASIGGTALYYQSLVNDRDKQISALLSQIEDKNNQIANLSSQVLDLESELTNLKHPQAKISAVSRDTIYPEAIVGVTTVIFFDVNITNTGLVPIDNASVVVEGNPQIPNGTYNSYAQTISLQPNQTEKVRCSIFVGLNNYKKLMDLGFSITVEYNGKVLAQMRYGF